MEDEFNKKEKSKDLDKKEDKKKVEENPNGLEFDAPKAGKPFPDEKDEEIEKEP